MIQFSGSDSWVGRQASGGPQHAERQAAESLRSLPLAVAVNSTLGRAVAGVVSFRGEGLVAVGTLAGLASCGSLVAAAFVVAGVACLAATVITAILQRVYSCVASHDSMTAIAHPDFSKQSQLSPC